MRIERARRACHLFCHHRFQRRVLLKARLNDRAHSHGDAGPVGLVLQNAGQGAVIVSPLKGGWPASTSFYAMVLCDAVCSIALHPENPSFELGCGPIGDSSFRHTPWSARSQTFDASDGGPDRDGARGPHRAISCKDNRRPITSRTTRESYRQIAQSCWRLRRVGRRRTTTGSGPCAAYIRGIWREVLNRQGNFRPLFRVALGDG